MLTQTNRVSTVAKQNTPSNPTSATGKMKGIASLGFLTICLIVFTCILCVLLGIHEMISFASVFLISLLFIGAASTYLVYKLRLRSCATMLACDTASMASKAHQIRAFLSRTAFPIVASLCFLTLDSEAQVYSLKTVEVEEIEGEYYKVGTQDEIIKFFHEKNLENREEIRAQIEYGYRAIEHNVDSYLDWYYKLSSTYLRVGEAVFSEQEEYEDFIAEKLEEHLFQGNPFYPLKNTLRNISQENPENSFGYKKILRNNLIKPHSQNQRNHTNFKIVGKWDSAIGENLYQEVYATKRIADKLGYAIFRGGTVATGAAVSTSISAKLGTGGVLAKAAWPLLKLVGAKVAGTAGGAATGAATGALACSWIPIIGTAVCAVIGGIAGGIAGGVVVDKVITEIGEIMNREEFKWEILDAIASTKSEMIYQFDL